MPSETGIPGFRDSTVLVSGGKGTDTVCSSISQYGPGEPGSVPGSCTGTSRYIGRPERPGYELRQRRGPQAGMSRVQGRVYASTPLVESVDQPVIQGSFLLSRIWVRVLFDSGVSYSFIVALVVIELGLKVEAIEEPLYVSSPLGIRARLGMLCRGCELEILGILHTVELRVMNMLEFDVILGMDWLTSYRFVIDCESRRVTA